VAATCGKKPQNPYIKSYYTTLYLISKGDFCAKGWVKYQFFTAHAAAI
jgi:hypothetical protein